LIDGVEVMRCPIWTTSRAGRFGRLLAPLSFAVAAAPYVMWRIIRSRPNVVLCVEPTLFSAPAALLAARVIGSKTILHVQDLEIDAAFAVGYVRGAFVQHLARLWERRVLNRFDHIVTISEKMRQALARKGPALDRVSVIQNWVALKDIFPQPRVPNSYRQELGFGEADKVVLYAGHLGKKQALDVIVAVANELRDEPHLKFVIVGEGQEKGALQRQAEGLPNVTFLPLQSPERLNDLLGLADIHVLPQRRDVADLVLPSKLGAMLASGRPVVAMADTDTELGHLLNGAAILVPPGDVNALKEAFQKAITDDLSQTRRLGLAIANSLSGERILSIFADLIRLQASRPRPRYEAVVNVSRSDEATIAES
jgi:colanic acid biosynthesis glycosyl transferase WcaI